MSFQELTQMELKSQFEDLLLKIKTIEDNHRNTSITTLSTLITLQNQMTELTSKHDSISLLILKNKSKLEKIDELTSFISKTNDVLTTHEIRISTAIKDISNAKCKYDKIILDNLNVPGFIGEYSKYKNLREYLDFNIKEMSILNSSKQKNEMDIKSYKEKIEGMMVDFQRQISQFGNQQKGYSEVIKKESFEYIDQCRNDFYEKFDEILIVNSKYAYELKDKSSKMQAEWEKILKIRNDINAKIDKTLEDIKTDNSKSLEILKSNNIEFVRIKSKFAEMVEFIKDVRFRKNLTQAVITRKDITHLTDKLQFNKKRKGKDIEEAKPLDLNYDVYTGLEIQTSDEIDREKYKNVLDEDKQSQNCKDRHCNDTNYILNSNNPGIFKGGKDNNESSNAMSNFSYISNNNIKQRHPLVDNSFKEKDQSSNNNSEIHSIKKFNASRNYKLLKKHLSSQTIDKYSHKYQQQQNQLFNKEWRTNSNKINKPINAASSLLNNCVLNTFDMTNYKFNQENPSLVKETKPKINGIESIMKQPVEGKLITLHYRENKSSTCIFGYENKEQIDLALKPSNTIKRHVGFSTTKEYNKVINKVFLSATPHLLSNAKTKSNPLNQTARDYRRNIKKDILEITKKSKLKYETINKVLSIGPKSQMQNQFD